MRISTGYKKQRKTAGPTFEAYTYDEVDNRLTSTAANSWTYNRNNELQSYNGANHQYDANGNRIQKNVTGQIRNYIYDVDNRLFP